MLAAAAAAGVPVWGDVELAWRLDQAGRYGPPRRWLVVTGTNGKTTTTSMLHAMLVAAGPPQRCCAATSATRCSTCWTSPPTLLAVELSSFQLHWAPSLRPEAGVVLNIAEDHLDWHGTMAAYAADKARVLDGRVAVVGLDDPVAAGAAGQPPPRRCGSASGSASRRAGELGVRDGVLVDRAFGRRAWRWPPAASIPVPGPVGVLDALAAAALARAVDVPRRRDRRRAGVVSGWAGTAPRWSPSSTASRYVDDSKATNPHAAEASMLPTRGWCGSPAVCSRARRSTRLVAAVANRLVGAVLIGRDRALIADALSRHAPDVPVVEVVTGEDSGVHGTNESAVTHVTRVVDVRADRRRSR